MKKRITFLGVAVLILGFAAQSFAVPIFTDWTSYSGNFQINGTALGTLTIGSNSTGVSFAGDIRNVVTNESEGVFDNDLSNWGSTDPFTPEINLSDSVRTRSGVDKTHTITFVNPVIDPVMHIASLGRGVATWGPSYTLDWTFDAPFTILSSNNGQIDGIDTYKFTNSSGYILHGEEGAGTIQFSGAFTSISWESDIFEDFTFFQVGAVSVVPEPTTMLLLGSGLIGLAGFRRKMRSRRQ